MVAAKKKRSRRPFFVVAIIIIAVFVFSLFKVFGPNTGTFTQGEYLYIHTGADYEKVKDALQGGGFISDMMSFDLLAKGAKLPAHIHPGKYKINKAMSNYNIIRMLHAGRQTPVKLVINKLRTKHDLINLLSSNLEADSLSLTQLLEDPVYLLQFGLDTNTAMCLVLPDTYDFFWNTTADKALRKLERNYTKFWDDTRKQQAREHNLTPVQAIILASVVDEETNINEDKPNIASVYLNRIRKGMKLEADPTVKFAMGDFTIRRIKGAMLQNPSPYNTYIYLGLPPGPICTPSAGSIQAVLEAPKTTYLYFCAKEDFSGRSNFASTYNEQLKNAHAYQKALNARGIN
ncbi:MAG: endolytic transglycosylase MltG [Chitinophagales bacterium]